MFLITTMIVAILLMTPIMMSRDKRGNFKTGDPLFGGKNVILNAPVISHTNKSKYGKLICKTYTNKVWGLILIVLAVLIYLSALFTSKTLEGSITVLPVVVYLVINVFASLQSGLKLYETGLIYQTGMFTKGIRYSDLSEILVVEDENILNTNTTTVLNLEGNGNVLKIKLKGNLNIEQCIELLENNLEEA